MAGFSIERKYTTVDGKEVRAEVGIKNLVLHGKINIVVKDIYKLVDALMEEGFEVEYDPDRFHGAIIRATGKLPNEKVTMIFLWTGNVTLTGCKSEEDAKKMLDVVVQAILKHPEIYDIKEQ